MSKVFIIEPPRHDIDTSKATEFGDIVYVFLPTSRRCSIWSHVHFGNTVLAQLKELNFNPNVDFICVVGAMTTISIAIIAISQYYDEFNVLLFNSVNDSYTQKRFCKGDWNGTKD